MATEGLPRRRVVAVLTAALAVGSSLSGCSTAADQASSTTPVGTAATETAAQPAQESELPGLIVIHRHYGLLLLDRRTRGKQFLLSGIQARECLSFLHANPHAAPNDVRAACPGAVTAAMLQGVATPSTKP
jgi:hypothetical protein